MLIIHPYNPGFVSTRITRIIHSLDNKCYKFSKNLPIYVRIIVIPGHCTLKLRTWKVALVDNSCLLRYYQPPPQPYLHIPNYVSEERTRIVYPPDNMCPEFLENSPIQAGIIITPGHRMSEPRTWVVIQIDNYHQPLLP